MSDDRPKWVDLIGIDPTYLDDVPADEECPDCAALQARLRTLDAKLAAARLALAACAEVREARNA